MSSIGAPNQTVERVPDVIDCIGGLLQAPQRQAVAFDVMGRKIADADPATRWSLLDAALLVTETLRDACVEMSGSPGLVFATASDWLELADLPEDVASGAQAITRILEAQTVGASAPLTARFRSGEASDEEFLGAVTTACYCSFLIVQAIAGISQTPLRKTWKRILLVLLEP
jgi:hypothetical protein